MSSFCLAKSARNANDKSFLFRPTQHQWTLYFVIIGRFHFPQYERHESDDEILKDLLQEINPENFEKLERSPTIGEFVLVRYEILGKTSNYYVGQIMNNKDSDSDYDVKPFVYTPPLQSPLSLWPPTALHNGLSLHSPMGLFLPCTPAVHDGFVTGLSRLTDQLAMGASWYFWGRDHGAFSSIRLPSV
ncbi:hypothetical protein C0J52_25145 [Blattella germanica]|nr:hypothetical protein C0J52_25145 [Blattella germanica]